MKTKNIPEWWKTKAQIELERKQPFAEYFTTIIENWVVEDLAIFQFKKTASELKERVQDILLRHSRNRFTCKLVFELTDSMNWQKIFEELKGKKPAMTTDEIELLEAEVISILYAWDFVLAEKSKDE